MHKAKTFCSVSLGILALALAFHLGARSARASYVPPGESGIVACASSNSCVLLDNGEVWSLPFTEFGWQRMSYDPPMPTSEIKFWELSYFISRSNELWLRVGADWVNYGSPPGLTATEPSTWGRMKARFGDSAR